MIKEAAVQRQSDGKIWTGRRHSNCIHAVVAVEPVVMHGLLNEEVFYAVD